MWQATTSFAAFQNTTCGLCACSSAALQQKPDSHKPAKLWRDSTHSHRRHTHRQLCQALSGKPVDYLAEDKRRTLLRFVQEVEPNDVLEHFQRSSPPSVVEAMKTTVTNMLGTLPPAYFSVTISASVEDLAQIMFCMLMTGYMYRNAQYRIDLDHVRRSFDEASGIESVDGASSIDFEALERLGRQKPPSYADGTQLTRVSGSVLRWRKDTEGLEEMDAQRYIRSCEDEITSLRTQVARSMYARGTGNELLDYLKVQEPQHLKELTENAGPCVLEAMNSFVQRLVGNGLRQTKNDATELARILYYLMVVGHSLRQLEVKCDFESSFTVSSQQQGGLLE